MNRHMKSVLKSSVTLTSGNQDKRGIHNYQLSEKERNISVSSRETKCWYSGAHAIAEDFQGLHTKLSAQGTPLSPPLCLQSPSFRPPGTPPKNMSLVLLRALSICVRAGLGVMDLEMMLFMWLQDLQILRPEIGILGRIRIQSCCGYLVSTNVPFLLSKEPQALSVALFCCVKVLFRTGHLEGREFSRTHFGQCWLRGLVDDTNFTHHLGTSK